MTFCTKSTKRTNTIPLLVVVAVVVVIVIAVVTPLCYSKTPSAISVEAAAFSNYAIEQAKTDSFDNPLFRLLTFKVVSATVEKTADNVTCSIYDFNNNGLEIALHDSYTAVVNAKTFFGITIMSARVSCNGESTVL